MNPKNAKTDLNLLPSQAKFQALRIRAQAAAKKVTVTMAIVWLSAVMLVLAGWLGSRWWLTAAEAKYQKATQSFLSLSEVTVTSQLLKFRAKLLGKILADRFEYYQAFSRVSQLFGEQVVVKDLVLKDRSVFKLNLAVNSGKLLDQVEEKVEEINRGETEGIKQAKILGVSYAQAGATWMVNLEVVLK